jgi:F-type H+-transporting ATPase subunit b
MEALGIDWKIIIVQVINFGLLVFVLNKFLYKPVLNAINKKNKEFSDIEDGKEDVEKQKKTLDQERERLMKAVQAEKREILKDARLDAGKLKKEALEKAEKQSRSLLEKAKKDVEAEKKTLKKNYEKAVLESSFAIAQKVIGNKVDKKDVKAAHSSLGQIKSQLWKD